MEPKVSRLAFDKTVAENLDLLATKRSSWHKAYIRRYVCSKLGWPKHDTISAKKQENKKRRQNGVLDSLEALKTTKNVFFSTKK